MAGEVEVRDSVITKLIENVDQVMEGLGKVVDTLKVEHERANALERNIALLNEKVAELQRRQPHSGIHPINQ